MNSNQQKRFKSKTLAAILVLVWTVLFAAGCGSDAPAASDDSISAWKCRGGGSGEEFDADEIL